MMLRCKTTGVPAPVTGARDTGRRARHRSLMRSLRRSLRQSLRRFSRDEDGVLLVFTMCLFLLMCMMGGVAVDLMRFEQQRTLMQQTLDRSVLAAASMTQRLEPEEVVADYFSKAGLEQYLDGVHAPEGLNFRQVRARASADVPTFLMHLVGIDNLQAVAGSEAEQRITNVEVSLVLDVSRSMRLFPNQAANPQKFLNLKDAAVEFVETVLENDIEDRISISLVPYNGQVNLGPNLMNQYNVTDQHSYPNSHCLDLPQPWTGTSHSISRFAEIPQAGFFDSFTGTTLSNRWYSSPSFTSEGSIFLNVWCQPIAANIVRPLQNDVDALTGYINGLVAVGATSIDLGLRWGLNLLSPDTRPVVTNLRNQNIVPAEFEGRPLDFSAEDAMKVIVLMTDGEHFAFESLNEDYRTGNTNIYRNRSDEHLSIWHSSRNQYWVPHRSEWRSSPWGGTNGSDRLTWPEVWAKYPVQWVAWQLYARALGTNRYNTWLNNFRSQTATGTMDSRLQDVCDIAKNNGIIIYGVAFELESTNGANQIRNCASTPEHFFDVEGRDISTAFRAIANNISQLRLTQ